MDVTLGQLLAQVEWPEIKAALCNQMGVEPAAISSHQKVYEHILSLPACPSGLPLARPARKNALLTHGPALT